jgi:hypothetical protein
MRDCVHGLLELALGAGDERLSILLAEQQYIIEADYPFSTISFK